MQSTTRKLRSRTLNGLLGLMSVGAILVAVPAAEALAADPPSDHAQDRAQHRADWAKHRMEWLRAHLDREANRLEITASQQAAWQNYAQARAALAEHGPLDRPEQGDAATLAQYRARRVQAMAQKLSVLADATAKLQVVLSPAQRTTLDEMARGGHRWHGHRGWGRGRDGMQRDGMQRDGMREDGHRAPMDGAMRGPGHAQDEAAPAETDTGPAA